MEVERLVVEHLAIERHPDLSVPIVDDAERTDRPRDHSQVLHEALGAPEAEPAGPERIAEPLQIDLTVGVGRDQPHRAAFVAQKQALGVAAR